MGLEEAIVDKRSMPDFARGETFTSVATLESTMAQLRADTPSPVARRNCRPVPVALRADHDACPPTSRSPETSGAQIPVSWSAEILTLAQCFWIGVDRVTEVVAFGAVKYDEFNWMKLPHFRRRFRSAALRHVRSHYAGQLRDSETGLYHLAHAACCLAFICEAEDTLTPPDYSPTGRESDGIKYDEGKLRYDLLPMIGISEAWEMTADTDPPDLLRALAWRDNEGALRSCLLLLGGLP